MPIYKRHKQSVHDQKAFLYFTRHHSAAAEGWQQQPLLKLQWESLMLVLGFDSSPLR